jgi:hypothetical protein
MEKENDRKVLDFFMDDSTWEEIPGKKTVLKKQRVEKPPVNQPNKIIESKIEDIVVQKELTKENPDGKNETANPEIEFGEVDYAILKSVTYGFKTIKEIAGALQIRTMVIEKHVYNLIKNGYIKYFQYCVITSKGKQAIEDFIINNNEDVWQPIDEFIESVIEQKKERNLKLQKMIDMVLLISIIVLILLIIYFGIFT